MKRAKRKPRDRIKENQIEKIGFDTDKYLQGLRKKLIVDRPAERKPKISKLFAILALALSLALLSLVLILNPSLVGFVT